MCKADYTVRPTGGAYNLFLISRASFSAHSSYAHPVGHHQEVMHTKGKLFETPTTNFSGWYARPIAPYRRPVRAGFQSIQRQRDANLSFPSCMHTAQIGPLGCAPTPGQKNQNLLRRKRLFSLRAAGALSASMLYVMPPPQGGLALWPCRVRPAGGHHSRGGARIQRRARPRTRRIRVVRRTGGPGR